MIYHHLFLAMGNGDFCFNALLRRACPTFLNPFIRNAFVFGVRESAGINRLGIENERVLQRKPSQ
jgi:hypothetical protein